MSEIKKMDLSGYDSSDSEKKGSLNVPYSIVEYEDAIKKNNWGGGYVAGIGYIKPLLQEKKDDDYYYNIYESIGGLMYDFTPVEGRNGNYKVKCYCHVNYCVDEYGNVRTSPGPIGFLHIEGLVNEVYDGLLSKKYTTSDYYRPIPCNVGHDPDNRIYVSDSMITLSGICDGNYVANINVNVFGYFYHGMTGSDMLYCELNVHDL